MAEATRREFLGQVGRATLATGALATGAWASAAFAFGGLTPGQLAGRPTHGSAGDRLELLRFLRETPLDAIVPAAVARLRAGLPLAELAAATLLAGLEDIRPRPVGFHFHCVLQLPAIGSVAAALPPAEQPLPFLFALQVYKQSQAAMATRSPWSLPPPPKVLPAASLAGAELAAALDEFDLEAADAAVTALHRTAPQEAVLDALLPFTLRDFADVGHHPIFGTAAFRLLDLLGWQHAEPLLRALVHGFVLAGRTDTLAPHAASRGLARRLLAERPALAAPSPFPLAPRGSLAPPLARSPAAAAATTGSGARPPSADLPAFTRAALGESSGSALSAMHALLRALPPELALQHGFAAAERVALELLLENPKLLSVHAATSIRALRELAACSSDRELQFTALFQAASWCPLWRKAFGGPHDDDAAASLDALARDAAALPPSSPSASTSSSASRAAELLADHGRVERRALSVALLRALDDARGDQEAVDAYRAAARALLVAKGREAHDWKYFAVIDEGAAADAHAGRPADPLPLVALTGYLRSSRDPDHAPTAEAREALAGR